MKKIKFNWLHFLIVFFSISMAVVLWKRKEIAENKFTQKKMEIFKAIYNNDVDSAKAILHELVDSTFFDE